MLKSREIFFERWEIFIPKIRDIFLSDMRKIFVETGEHLSDTRIGNNFISLIEGKYFLLGGIYILHVVPDGCTEC